jgi:hypothetical protein
MKSVNSAQVISTLLSLVILNIRPISSHSAALLSPSNPLHKLLQSPQERKFRAHVHFQIELMTIKDCLFNFDFNLRHSGRDCDRPRSRNGHSDRDSD